MVYQVTTIDRNEEIIFGICFTIFLLPQSYVVLCMLMKQP